MSYSDYSKNWSMHCYNYWMHKKVLISLFIFVTQPIAGLSLSYLMQKIKKKNPDITRNIRVLREIIIVLLSWVTADYSILAMKIHSNRWRSNSRNALAKPYNQFEKEDESVLYVFILFFGTSARRFNKKNYGDSPIEYDILDNHIIILTVWNLWNI